jgi:hypothetical protein
MSKYLCLSIISTFVAMASLSQPRSPCSSYTLHAQKEPAPWSLIETLTSASSVLTITPDNALVVLIPQPHKKWVLKRLTSWSILPDLKPTSSCHCNVVREFRDGSNGWENQTDKDANADCAAILEAADISSVDTLPGADHTRDRVAKLLKFGCWITDVSKDEKFALYICTTSHASAWDTVKIDFRACVVLSVADGKTVVSIPLPFRQPIAAALARADGQEYLLLLRDGIKLETYRLPYSENH